MWGIVPVFGVPNGEAVRVIRNACRLNMTRDQREISPEEQSAWFSNKPRGVRVFLFRLGDEDVGYGLIREEMPPGDGVEDAGAQNALRASRFWLSGGLLPDWRGRGLGHVLFRLLIAACGTMSRGSGNSDKPEVWLEVLYRNIEAKTLYYKLGFREVDRHDGPHGRVMRMKLSYV